VLKEIDEANGQIILFIDELHTLSGRARPRAPLTPATCSSPPWPAENCAPLAPPRSTNTASTLRRMRRSKRRFQIVYVGGTERGRHDRDSARPEERYEAHHNVRIKDAAMLPRRTFASLSATAFAGQGHRPGGRGCAASLAIQIGSVPTEIDQLERDATSLEIERAALKRENRLEQPQPHEGSGARVATLKSRLLPCVRAGPGARSHQPSGQLKKKIESLRFEAEEQTRKGQLDRAAQIQYW